MTNAGNAPALPLPTTAAKRRSCSHAALQRSCPVRNRFLSGFFYTNTSAFSTRRRDTTALRDEMDLLDIWQVTEHGFQFAGLCWRRSRSLRRCQNREPEPPMPWGSLCCHGHLAVVLPVKTGVPSPGTNPGTAAPAGGANAGTGLCRIFRWVWPCGSCKVSLRI